MHQKIQNYQNYFIRITSLLLDHLTRLCGLLEIKLLHLLLHKLLRFQHCHGLVQVIINHPFSDYTDYLIFLFVDLEAEYTGKKIKISSELFAKGCVQTTDQGLQAAQKIGYPVMIKASEGGGGKGIRKVDNENDFAAAFRQVCSLSFLFVFTRFHIIKILCRCKLKFQVHQYLL